MRIEVMKPCHPNKDNKSHQRKVEEALADNSEYVAERKIDGCHYVCVGGTFLSTHESRQTQQLVDKTDRVPHLHEALSIPALSQVVLDGEINLPGRKSYDVVSIMGSLPDEALRKQFNGGEPVHYTVFDILRAPDGTWLFNEPWHARRRLLIDLLPYYVKNNLYIDISHVVLKNKRQFLDQILSSGGEGIVLKHRDGLYYPGKRPMWNWIKLKAEMEDDAIIVGFEPAEKIYTGKDVINWPYWEGDVPVTKHYYFGWIGSIILGKYNRDGNLVRIGKCAGIDEATRADMTRNPDRYVGQVAKIKAMEVTHTGTYRHARFLMLHPDKNPRECIL